jgi:glycolate oxidase iron-sulfur subunit
MDPVRLEAAARACISCGLCLPHCATYLAGGDERRSPRGRILLLCAVLRDADHEDAATVDAFDTCLGCRACETMCPSGVPFALLEAARARADAALGPAPGPLIPRLASRRVLRGLRRAGAGARGVLRSVLGVRWRRRLDETPVRELARRLGTLPVSPSDRGLIARLDALSGLATPATAAPPQCVPSGRRVVFFTGCASRELTPATQSRLLFLLRGAGVEVVVPVGQDCCGALAAHTAAPAQAARLRARNAAVLTPATDAADALIVEAAGCGLELKGYPEPLASAAVDAVVYLADLPLPPLRPVPLKAVYHDPCHARHGQGIIDAPRRLLARVPGLVLLEPEEAEVCCGSGGAYSLRHPELSSAMGRRKADRLAATGADLVLTSNPGCQGQIADALARDGVDLPVLSLTDLLWYASLS